MKDVNLFEHSGGQVAWTAPKKLKRRTITEGFLKKCQDHFPRIFARNDFRSLFWWLVYGAQTDEDTGHLLLDHRMLAGFMGLPTNLANTGRLLDEFKAVLPPDCVLEIVEYEIKKKSRQVETLHFGAFQVEIEKERATSGSPNGKVYLDGRKFTRDRAAKLRNEAIEEASNKKFQCEEAKSIADYLHSLPPQVFTNILKNIPAAFEAIETEKKDSGTKRAIEAAIRLLDVIKSDPFPIYSPTENTVRLYAGESLQFLSSKIRSILLEDWEQADLRACQFAVCVKLYNIPKLQSFLRAEKIKFWDYCLNILHVPADDRDDVKSELLKPTVYSIAFGMSRENLGIQAAKICADMGFPSEYARNIFQIDHVKTLLRARGGYLQGLLRDEGGFDAFGNFYNLTEERPAHKIAAAIAQSYEMRLIAPAFKIAESVRNNSKAFKILIFLHDGIYCFFKRSADKTKKKIAAAVKAEADKLGIITQLDWK